MVTVKLFFGISYLAMPNIFAHAGWFGGIMLYTIAILLNGYTMTQLLDI
jgi:amino acid permease